MRPGCPALFLPAAVDVLWYERGLGFIRPPLLAIYEHQTIFWPKDDGIFRNPVNGKAIASTALELSLSFRHWPYKK